MNHGTDSDPLVWIGISYLIICLVVMPIAIRQWMNRR
jgi:hypothetical protein